MKFHYVLVGLAVLITAGLLTSSSYAKIDPASVVGIWLLDEDEGTQATDSSGNGHHGVVTALGWVEGKFGSALENAGGTTVQVEHNDAFSLQTFTLTCWVKIIDTGAYQAVFGKQADNPTRNYRVEIHPTGVSRISFGSDGQAGAGSVLGTTVVVNDEWHHIVATYDMEQLKIYVDGVLDGTQQKNLEPATNNSPLQMGMVSGVVDELGIFNVALEEEDIIMIRDRGLIEVLEPSAVNPSSKLSTTWAEVKIHY